MIFSNFLKFKKMKVLFISGELISGDLAYKLKKEGCDVKLFIDDENMRDCLDGLVEKIDNWKDQLNWVGKEGLIVFDDVGYGEDQDTLRKEGYTVLGAGARGDILELDRVHAQEILKSVGVIDEKFETKNFNIDDAIRFVASNGGKWVIKQADHNTAINYIGSLEDGSDSLNVLKNYREVFGGECKVSLQSRVYGVEIALGRFFNGREWIGPCVINFEHKHLCDGDVGPLGGETGTLMWFDGNEQNKLFQKTLAKLKDHLSEINYRGYIDINCIVNEDDIYPLELTSRFGSSTIETQQEIQISPWKDFLFAVAKGDGFNAEFKKGYCINVAITVPPFPYRTTDKSIINRGANIFFSNLGFKDFEHIHFEGVSVKDDVYFTAGNLGYVMYITNCNSDIERARGEVYKIIDKIMIPKMFYRSDIGTRFLKKDKELLEKWGWI